MEAISVVINGTSYVWIRIQKPTLSYSKILGNFFNLSLFLNFFNSPMDMAIIGTSQGHCNDYYTLH